MLFVSYVIAFHNRKLISRNKSCSPQSPTERNFCNIYVLFPLKCIYVSTIQTIKANRHRCRNTCSKMKLYELYSENKKASSALGLHQNLYFSWGRKLISSGIILPWLLLLFWTISDSIWASKIRFDPAQGLDIGFSRSKRNVQYWHVRHKASKIFSALYTL